MKFVRNLLSLLPAGLVLVWLFLLPMTLLLMVSFWSVHSFKLQADFSFDAYVDVFKSYGGVLVSTLVIGAATAAICTVVGFIFSYGVRFRAGRWGDTLVVATLITLFGGYLVKIYAWKAILSQDGLINLILISSGLVDGPLDWLIYNQGSVILALVHFLLPFAILPIYAELRNVPEITLEAAQDLGASRFQILAWVVIPQCRFGIFSAFAIVFLGASGDYVTPTFLGGGSGVMLGQFIAQNFSTRFNWPGGAAMSFVLMGACLAVLSAIGYATARRRCR